jgi:hypothetical protein
LDALTLFIAVSCSVGGLVLFGLVLCRLVGWARGRANGAYVFGALLTPFMGVGDVVDPDFRIVNETKQEKREEEDDSGDPPEPGRNG